jgi:hypothetical protein
MTGRLGPFLTILLSLTGVPAADIEVRGEAAVHEEDLGRPSERRPASRPRQAIRPARTASVPKGPSVQTEAPPLVLVDRVGPRTSRRTVRPPTGA